MVSNAADVTLIVGIALLAAFQRKIKDWLEKKTNDKFVRSINKTSIIRDMLAEVRALYGADRVLLFQLHNGQYYFSGEGADKLSLTHFVTDVGIAVPERAGTRLQNILTSYWPETLKTLAEKQCFYAASSDFTDPFMAQMLAIDGVQFVLCSAVKDRKKLWKGVLVVCFMKDNGSDDASIMQEYATKIGDLLSL